MARAIPLSAMGACDQGYLVGEFNAAGILRMGMPAVLAIAGRRAGSVRAPHLPDFQRKRSALRTKCEFDGLFLHCVHTSVDRARGAFQFLGNQTNLDLG